MHKHTNKNKNEKLSNMTPQQMSSRTAMVKSRLNEILDKEFKMVIINTLREIKEYRKQYLNSKRTQTNE